LQEQVIEIFSWENPSRTVAFMLGYILLCLFPSLCLILPQSLALYFLAQQYYFKAKRHAYSSEPTKLNPSLQYLKNMQFIQNHMGIFADGYDEVQTHKKLVDWRDEEETMHLVYYIVFSMAAAVVVSRLVPINILCLFGGLSLFIKNTALFQAASQTLQPVVIRHLQDNADYVREAISNVSRATSRAGVSKTTVQIFENQV
jgi:hypothetical protein